MNSKVSIIKCSSYEPALVQDSIAKAIGLLGGIMSFIKPDSKVLVKPNLLMAKEPEAGITTHPEVVRAVIKLLKGINCKIFVGDSPSVWGKYIENVDNVYELTGIKKICLEEGVELVKFEKRRMREKFPLTTWLDECDHLVNIAKFKTHGLTILSAALKNNFGLVCGTFKTELHKNYFEPESFAGILADIYKEAKPALTIVDGILAMEGDGPATGGKLRRENILLAGADCVALDSVLANIMGIHPEDILSTKIAAQRGLGEAKIENITILGESLKAVRLKPFLLPASSMLKRKIPKPLVAALARKLIKYYPCVEADNCIACAACVKACPNKIVSLKNKRITFDYSKCIACFCCQEVCPNAAIKVKKSLLAKMVGL